MYEYFLKMVDVPNVELTDKMIGDYFGWKKHKVKMHRLLLQSAGYFHVEKIKSNAGRAGFVYHVGLDAVSSQLETGRLTGSARRLAESARKLAGGTL